MDLQFKIDEFTARVDGLAAMGINVDTDLSSPEGSKNERVLAHKMITAEVTNLEKQILALEIELQQQSSMHKSIVDGLESHCKMLAEEIDEAKDYICTLEDLQDRLETNVEELKKESKDKSRKCSDLSTACNILRHQKAILEKSNSGVMSGVRKLVEIVALNSTRVNGFSSTTRPPQSWSLELEYIVQFIQQAVKTNQKYLLDIEKAKAGGRLLQICESPVTADAITPKAKGRSTTLKVTNFVSKHAATLNDIKNTKDVIKNVMASPRLTPMKAANHERNETYDESYDDDLYSDLVVAVEQLERLSEKIEQFEEEESKWNATEISFKTRIQELEQEVQDHVANKATHSTNLTLKQQDEKLKEIGATMIYNFHQRQRKAMLVHAFQNCRTQARLSKHLNLAKEMAKELIETRKKVLLLKHHFDSS